MGRPLARASEIALHAGGGRHVHHVERGAGHALGQPQHAPEAQVLRQRVVHLGQVLEADAALADQLGVHVHDDVVVLGVDDAEPALLGEHLEHLPDVAEVDHAPGAVRPDVGGEDLDRRVAGLDGLGQLAHLRVRRLAAEHQVVGPVAAALGRELLVARLDPLLHAAVGRRVGEIDQRGGAAPQRRHADPVGPLRVERLAVRRHERVRHVHVRIDAAGHDDLARRVDDARRIRVGQRAGRRDRGDRLALDGDIAPRHALRRHHVAAANDQVEHGRLPVGWVDPGEGRGQTQHQLALSICNSASVRAAAASTQWASPVGWVERQR